MDFKSLLSQLDQLNEAKEKTKTGLKHTAEPGGYGRKDDEDDEGHKVKADAVKKGKGRPKKDADDSGETKKYDFSAFGVKSGKDVKLPKHDKKKTTVIKGKSQSHADNKKDDGTDPETKTKKKGLKEYFDSLDKALNENNYTTAPMPGAVQVKDASGKVVATAKSPQAAEMFKKGDVTLGNPEEMHEEDIGKHNNATTGFDALVKKLTPKYGVEAAKRIAVGQLKKIREADQPPNDSLLSPMSEARAKADDKAEKAGKKVTKDLEYDMKHKGKDDAKAEKAGKKVTKDIEYDEKKKIKEAAFKQEYRIFLESKGIKVTNEMLEEGWKEKLAAAGTAAAIGATSLGMMGGLPGQSPSTSSVTKPTEFSQQIQAGQQVHNKAEAMAKVNKQFAQEYYSGINKITTSGFSPKLENQKALEFTQQLLAKYQANESMLEAKKPDANKNGIPDYAEDGKGKNDLKKKKVKEGMDHRLKAARHMGKAHALTKEGYNCRYDDMEESRHYHEGYKEGLDECYGQMPIQGYVGETNNEVADMASYGAHTPTMEDDMYEMDKTAYMKQQAIKTPGDTFKAFGQTFKDKEVVESPFFEAWDKELNAILEGKDVTEGMTVSISKGQQGMPDSVSVSAQDSEADQLLSIIKQSGLGLFGGDDAGQPQSAQPMTVDVDGGEGPQADIAVVDDHDDMLSLIRKMTGQGPAQSNGDYEEEGGEPAHAHAHEETCESCGSMMEEGHSCGEAVEEDESMDQREYEVAEEINPNNNDEAEEEQSDATRDAALATAAGKNFANTDSPIEEGGDGGEASEEPTEEQVEESLANGNDDTFETDIDFMTKVISGGLNKQKSTGQTTIPVVSTQVNRLGSPMKESTDLLTDWRKLSGIK
jgi:predicted secreted protein